MVPCTKMIAKGIGSVWSDRLYAEVCIVTYSQCIHVALCMAGIVTADFRK